VDLFFDSVSASFTGCLMFIKLNRTHHMLRVSDQILLQLSHRRSVIGRYYLTLLVRPSGTYTLLCFFSLCECVKVDMKRLGFVKDDAHNRDIQRSLTNGNRPTLPHINNKDVILYRLRSRDVKHY